MQLALYRQYRPKTFSDLIGQEDIIKILQNQMKQATISHAYLFTGSRGTGKTSTAKVFAKALNCQNKESLDPCGTCPACLQEELDIIEMDAASHNSVDNIRDIRDQVRYTPNIGTYKIYIIDEVHMLSQGAFNALLKTLEEPPTHVIFILATTEPHKIPSTILSRVQRFDFKKISTDTISKRLLEIAQEKGFEAEADAMQMIAEKADGSMRDALSLLDKAMGTNDLSMHAVSGSIGESTLEEVAAIWQAICDKNLSESLQQMNQVQSKGLDSRQMLRDLTSFLRNCLYAKLQLPALIPYGKDLHPPFYEIANQLTKEQVTDYLEELSLLASNLRYASQPQVLLETKIIEFIVKEEQGSGHEKVEMHAPISAQVDQKLEKVYQKIEELEKSYQQLEKSYQQLAKRLGTMNPLEQELKETENEEQQIIHQHTEAVELDQDEQERMENLGPILEKIYQDLTEQRKANVKALLQQADLVRYVGKQIYFSFPSGSELLKQMIDTPENQSLLTKTFSEALGEPHLIYFIDRQQAAQVQDGLSIEEVKEKMQAMFPDVPIAIYPDKQTYLEEDPEKPTLEED